MKFFFCACGPVGVVDGTGGNDSFGGAEENGLGGSPSEGGAFIG